MGRVALPEEQKRKQIAVRLGPEDRDRLQRLADENGTSLGAEVERLALERLDYLENTDEPTRELLAAIASEIEVIQQRTKKRWHQDLATWAAVGEMLRHGPIQQMDPDNPRDDDVVKEAWEKVYDIDMEKKAIADHLTELGFSVNPQNPSKDPQRRGGLFGTSLALRPRREREREMIEREEDGPLKDDALRLFARIEELDREESKANRQHAESMQIYWDAKAQGRNLYRDMLRERAERTRAEGGDYIMSHLLGWFE